MNKKSIYITIKKEIRSIIRDRKTIITIFIFPIIIPLMIFLYAYIYDNSAKEEYYNIGLNYQPNTTEKSIMNKTHLKPKYYKDINKIKKIYNNKKIGGYIIYNKKNNKYIIYTNKDSEEGIKILNYTTSYLESYNNYLTKLYLIGEDIDADNVYNNFTYTTKNLEGENFILKTIFTVAFTYIIMSIVLASTNMATSATAVEKENGTLETLLTFPISASELITGKYLSCVIISFISSIIGLILTIISTIITSNNFEILKTVNFSVRPLTIIIGLLTCISSSIFISALAIAITSFAKTYKEAQSSSQTLSILTMIPMMISIMGTKITTIYYLIPIANYVQLLMDIFSNNFSITNILIVFSSSIIYVLIVIKFIINQYKEEKVLFGI